MKEFAAQCRAMNGHEVLPARVCFYISALQHPAWDRDYRFLQWAMLPTQGCNLRTDDLYALAERTHFLGDPRAVACRARRGAVVVAAQAQDVSAAPAHRVRAP